MLTPITLSVEERNVLLALVDAGTKHIGAELFRQEGAEFAQSAYKKLAAADEMPTAGTEAEA